MMPSGMVRGHWSWRMSFPPPRKKMLMRGRGGRVEMRSKQ